MPTYQYACTVCGHRFEAVQAFTDATLTECPECPGRLRKVFSSVGIVFKGSGFYRTDSRAGAVAGGSGEKSGETSTSDSKSSSDSTAAKPAKSADSSSSSASTTTAKAS